MVYDFLPFMILPLYNTLTKLDSSMIEAAQDLGATKIQVLFKVIIPLSIPGRSNHCDPDKWSLPPGNWPPY